MKATINGIQVEGTPQEIADYSALQNKKTEYLPPLRNIKVSGVLPSFMRGPAVCIAAQNGGCNCTGACQT